MKNKLKHYGKLLLKPEYRREYFFLKELSKLPRFIPAHINLLNTRIEIVDSASFLSMHNEIFKREIYRFRSDNSAPVIIDGGANIGLSVIYFKKLYPNASIYAFEPDNNIFRVLSDNIKSFGFANVELVKKALWDCETKLEFMAEGADGGRIVSLETPHKKVRVQTARLRDYLHRPVDFLKLDIEGAETQVLLDSKDILGNVKNMFVEYHSFNLDPQTLNVILDILSANGFRIHIQSILQSPQPFIQRNVHYGMDMQLNIFAFRQ